MAECEPIGKGITNFPTECQDVLTVGMAEKGASRSGFQKRADWPTRGVSHDSSEAV